MSHNAAELDVSHTQVFRLLHSGLLQRGALPFADPPRHLVVPFHLQYSICILNKTTSNFLNNVALLYWFEWVFGLPQTICFRSQKPDVQQNQWQKDEPEWWKGERWYFKVLLIVIIGILNLITPVLHCSFTLFLLGLKTMQLLEYFN